MKRPNYELVRIYSGDRDCAKVSIQHLDTPEKATVFGSMSYDRITADLHVTWSYDCPLSLLERLNEILRFVQFLRNSL